jgi:hypothetical protein
MKRLTRDLVEQVKDHIEELAAASEVISDPAEVWLDEEADRDERSAAREELDDLLPELIDKCVDVLSALDPKRLA